jgi:hypothetical protein
MTEQEEINISMLQRCIRSQWPDAVDNMREHGPNGNHSPFYMIGDFKKRLGFTAVTIPMFLLTPMIQHWLGMGEAFRFAR